MNHTAQTVIAEIEENAKTVATVAGPEMRMVRTIEVGEHVRQGDCLIERLSTTPKAFAKASTERQLAPGTTQGSRHVLTGEAELFIDPKADALTGPVFAAKGRCVVTHPEHAHVSLPSGTYGVTYERDLEREEIARVVD